MNNPLTKVKLSHGILMKD